MSQVPTNTAKKPAKVFEAKIYIDIPADTDPTWARNKIREVLQTIWGGETRVMPNRRS